MRYAYWRRPDGLLHKQDDDRYAPTALLAEIGTTARVNGNAISWPSTSLFEYETAAYPSIAIIGPDKRELNEADTIGIVHSAVIETIRELGGGRPVLPQTVLRRVDEKAAALYRQPQQTRYLVTSLSLDQLPVGPIDLVDSCQLAATDRNKFEYPPVLLSSNGYVRPHVKGTRYKPIAISTNESTVNQALESGMRALNFIRGIWNLLATFQTSSFGWSQAPRRKWIGLVHVGPIHTLHNADGTACCDTYWYEPDYVEDAEIYRPAKGWDDFDGRRAELCREIDVLPYKTELVDVLARYSIALDQANLNVAFLMLWSLLEKVTDTVGKQYDETIERAIWTYKECAIAKQLLAQMRWRRNHFVHSARSSTERDQLCYITKRFVDGHLRMLIFNPFKVSSLAEYGEFLSLPHNEEQLKKMRDRYELAHSLRSAGREAPKSSEGPPSAVVISGDGAGI